MSDQDALEERLSRQIDAYHEAALLYAAVRLGLPNTLATGPLTAEQLAGALGLSAPHLHRFLRGLCTIGICAERADGTFSLALAGRCLTSASPSRLAGKIQIVVGQYWRPWANLVSSLQTGAPAFDDVFGMSVLDWRSVNAAQGALFDSYLAEQTLAQADDIVAALDFSGVRSVADIGGGYGGLLAAILKAYPDLNGILFERPHTIAAAKVFLQSQGVADRARLSSGDPLAAIPVQADFYLLNGVLRQWDDDAARVILANVRSAMPGAATLLIIERPMPERAADDPAAIMLDLHMMTITGGRTRSLAEFEALLTDAGLAMSNVASTRSGLSLFESSPS